MRPAGRKASQGFTLIELMVVVSMIGIFIGVAVPMEIANLRLSESEVGLQRAIQVLRSEVEFLRLAPAADFTAGATVPFDPGVTALEDLVEGKGEVAVTEVADRPGLLRLTVTVSWRDARVGPRSLHTVIYKRR